MKNEKLESMSKAGMLKYSVPTHHSLLTTH